MEGNMLAHVLAMVVGLSSFSLYMAAFFFPEVHRKYDFAWSGLGMFYALVLWVCAGRITGGVLLGQTASVTLLGWVGWQMLSLRRSLTPIDQQTALPGNARTIGESIQLKIQDLRSRSGNLQIPDGVDRFVRQSGHWLIQATRWIQAWLRGIQKPKKRSPVAVRPPVQPVSILTPTQSGQTLETALVEEIAEAVEALPEETLLDKTLLDETLLEKTLPDELVTIEPEAVPTDAPFAEAPSVEVMSVEVAEPIVQPPLASGSRPIAKPRSRQQNNFLTSVRNRVQNTLNSLGQRNVKPPVVRQYPLAQRLDDLDDDDFEQESIELEITTAVLEDKIVKNRDKPDPDRVEEIVAEVIEDLVAAEVTVEVVEDQVKANRVEVIVSTEPPLSDDIADSENPEFVTVPDAAIEAEINWEAVISDEPDSTQSSLMNAASVTPLDSMPDIPPSNPIQP
jgi:Ycf66 protein N-terminus